jgi:hypothetical protein
MTVSRDTAVVQTVEWGCAVSKFRFGQRVIVMTIEHSQPEARNLTRRRGTVRQVYPYPTRELMECGVVLDGEEQPRLFPPPPLAEWMETAPAAAIVTLAQHLSALRHSEIDARDVYTAREAITVSESPPWSRCAIRPLPG